MRGRVDDEEIPIVNRVNYLKKRKVGNEKINFIRERILHSKISDFTTINYHYSE